MGWFRDSATDLIACEEANLATARVARATWLADVVRAEVREVDPLRVLLTFLFLAPFLLGWLVGAAWTALAWMCAAIVAGYRQGAGRPRGREDSPG